MRDRVTVSKTYKLFIGGKFPRSESGRVYPVHDGKGAFLANAAHASRKDLRDAVSAARKAFAGWSGATAYNRGQVLYRVAEMLEGRRDQFVSEVSASEKVSARQAESIVDASVDRWVWYAGWTDKIASVLGAANPVAGPYFSFTVPEPTGVAGVLAPQRSSLLGLVSVLAPVLATGCTAVVVSSADRPLPAITLSEVLATSDVPGGVVNILTGQAAELGPWLASHGDVDALDTTGVEGELRTELVRAAAGTVKRVLSPPAGEPDWTSAPGITRLRHYLEPKTVWHPAGL
ncbi:aldehyde dehydrogenase family protein [Amycolatopsis pigmentata]|uniref:Aldehyde dehydrogenase family protein n=1 Tax=Amycolatopsis pigmentata TaxID=450801 RepID=A0ABW5G3W6_9PSEU